MSNLLRKIIAVATSFTVGVMLMGPVRVKALTAEEIQAQIEQLMAQLSQLQAQLAALEGEEEKVTIEGIPQEFTFEKNLYYGMSDTDVKYLQIVLNSDPETKLADSGVGSPGNETNYFGPLTKAAVINFQEKYQQEILAPWGLTKGTGFVGSTTRTKLNSLLTQVVPTEEEVAEEEAEEELISEEEAVVPTTGVTISLAEDTPSASVVAKGAYDVVFTKIKFTAGSDSDYTINKIIIHRGGVSEDDDVKDIKLYDGDTQLGNTQALNTTTHKATFSGLNWTISAGQSKVLTIKATIDSTNADAGNSVKFGIATASDVTIEEGVMVEGAPVYGNSMTIAGVSVGQLDVDFNTTPAAGDVISGATDQYVASIKFTASSEEGFDVKKIVLTEVGTSVDADIKNIKLKYLGTQLGNTVESLTDGKAVFEDDPLFSVSAGTSKDIEVYVDIASGVISERTIKFEITEANDVLAFGQNTGGAVVITHDSGTTYAAEQSQEQTIKQGTLTVVWDTATNPASTYYVVGSSQNTIASFKFSAGSREGVKITKLKLNKAGTIDDSEFQNVQLYIDGSSQSTGHVGSISSGVITFSDANGLFEIQKSDNTVVTVKADITTAADNGDTIGFYISALSNIEMKGIASDAKIYSDSDHLTISAVDSADEATTHTVKGYGNLVISNAPDTPAGINITLGQSDIEVLKFRLAAEYEDMVVSSIKVRFWNDSDLSDSDADTAATSTDYISNVKLYDGTTLLAEKSTPSAGYVNFSVNLIVPRNQTKTLTVKVDIPTTSNLQYLAASVGAYSGSSGITASDELTTTGVSSAQNINESGGAAGNIFTLQTPTLTVAAASVPPAQYVVSNSSKAWLGRLQLTSDYEDIKVTKVVITFDDNVALNGGSSAEDVFSNIKIYVGDTQIGSTKQINDAQGSNNKDIVVFDSIENLTISKDQTVSLDIYAEVNATSSDTTSLTWYVGHASNTDIIGSGLFSGTSVTSEGDTQVSNGTTIRSSGDLVVSVDADTPVDANVAVGVYGKSGVEFAKIKFEAQYEDVKVKKIVLTLTDPDGTEATSTAGSYDFNKVYLYEGDTNLTPDGAPFIDSTVTFTNDAGLFVVPSGSSKVITVKADLFGLGTGAYSGDAPKIYLPSLTTNIISEGVSSNAAITETVNDPSPESASNFGAMYLYKTTVTVTKNASSPEGAATPGAASEVLRFDVTADSAADAVLNALALTISGSVDITGTGAAYLYKSTDLVNELAKESVVSVLNVDASSSNTSATTSDVNDFAGIPAGATLRIYDASESAYMVDEVKVTKIASSTPEATITFTAATNNIETGDDLYYYPMQPGSGKLYFGARTYLAKDLADNDTTIYVDDASGFAVGDIVKFTNAYTSTGTSVTWDSGCQVVGFDTTVTPNTLTVTNCQLSNNSTIDYDYFTESATDSVVEQAVVYVSGADNEIGETIAAGTTKTFIVKGDTTGATSDKTLRVDIISPSDFNWDDKVQESINARTQIIPLTGGTLTY